MLAAFILHFALAGADAVPGVDCFSRPIGECGVIITVLNERMSSESWRVLQSNRIATAEHQGAAYCEYHGSIDSERTIPWNKLNALEHALFYLNFTYVMWLDADAFFADPSRDIVSQFGVTECGLSSDWPGSGHGITNVNSGVGFLRRTSRVQSFLRTVMNDGYKIVTANPRVYPPRWWEQNAVRWYVGKWRSMFALAGSVRPSNVFGIVYKYGDMQAFPARVDNVEFHPRALVRHFPGLDHIGDFHARIAHVARALQIWHTRRAQ